MADLSPFRAVRYDTRRVDLSQVIVPPYDVIAADEREAFYRRDPHNAIRFELTRDADDEASTDYSEVGLTLQRWLEEGVLERDARPAFYAMSQSFISPGGEGLLRTGFFGALRLEDYAARIVRPHERTLAGPKADRLKLLRASRANLSSVFMLYEDRDDELGALLSDAFTNATLASARDDAGVDYALARIDGDGAARIRGFMADRPIVIADGHHRYETALAYRDQQRAAAPTSAADAPYESTLAFFANAYAPGSLLLPIHRVIRKQALLAEPKQSLWQQRLVGDEGWQLQEVALGTGSEVGIASALAQHLAPLAGHPALAADDGNGTLRVYSRPEMLGDSLMVRVLEDQILGRVFGLSPDSIRDGAVGFPKSAERAASEVRFGDGAVALYLNPLAPEDVFRVTAAGEVMPQKSTFFYPKVPTGFVFRTHGTAAS